MRHNLIVVLGPTASGKTRLGVEIARHFRGEVISADSRQVYRGLDIGTGKDLEEYQEIPHHLIDIVDPGHEYSLFEFQRDFFVAFDAILSRRRRPLLVGGTGLYLDSIISGYDLSPASEDHLFRTGAAGMSTQALRAVLKKLRPEQHNTTDLLDRNRLIRAIEIARNQTVTSEQRTEFTAVSPFILGIHLPAPILKKRISERLKRRLDHGLIDEVSALNRHGVSWETLDYFGLEYRFVGQHVRGELNRNDMYQKLNAAIRRFAKRQETWFRKMEKAGVHIHWLDGTVNLDDQAVSLVEERFEKI